MTSGLTVDDKDTSVKNLDLEGFANLFGIEPAQMPEDCVRMIAQQDFRYRHFSKEERDALILSVMKRIDTDSIVAGPDRKDKWEKGWQENLDQFINKKFAADALVPKYLRPGQPVRLFQDYVQPMTEDFEVRWLRVFTRWLFQTYFRPYDAVYEFGCGSGINVEHMASIFPDKKLFGMDWAQSSVNIVNGLSKVYGPRVTGRTFDFFHPDRELRIAANSAVMTLGALEQTGQRYEEFVRYLVDSKPALCVTVEPTIEWYDPNNLTDYLAIKFHQRRGYWQGFIDLLNDYQKKGRVQILKTKRSYFGSLLVEGYSQTVWRVLE